MAKCSSGERPGSSSTGGLVLLRAGVRLSDFDWSSFSIRVIIFVQRLGGQGPSLHLPLDERYE